MIIISYNSFNLAQRKYFDSKVDISNINNNKLLSILPKERRFFIIEDDIQNLTW